MCCHVDIMTKACLPSLGLTSFARVQCGQYDFEKTTTCKRVDHAKRKSVELLIKKGGPET